MRPPESHFSSESSSSFCTRNFGETHAETFGNSSTSSPAQQSMAQIRTAIVLVLALAGKGIAAAPRPSEGRVFGPWESGVQSHAVAQTTEPRRRIEARSGGGHPAGGAERGLPWEGRGPGPRASAEPEEQEKGKKKRKKSMKSTWEAKTSSNYANQVGNEAIRERKRAAREAAKAHVMELSQPLPQAPISSGQPWGNLGSGLPGPDLKPNLAALPGPASGRLFPSYIPSEYGPTVPQVPLPSAPPSSLMPQFDPLLFPWTSTPTSPKRPSPLRTPTESLQRSPSPPASPWSPSELFRTSVTPKR